MQSKTIKMTSARGYYQSIGRRLLNVEETAKLLNLSPKTIRNMTGPKSQKPFPVPFKRFGRRILFDVRDVEKFIQSL